MDAPEYARGQAVARQVGPARAAVGRAVQAAPRTAAREVPWQPSCLPERGIDDARVVRIEADIDRAGLLVLVEDLAPGLAAVGAAEHAALGVGAEGMAEGRDQNDIGILRVDDQGADLAGVPEADVAPGLAAVDRLVDAIAVRHVAARGRLPGADIDDVRIRGRDGERDGRSEEHTSELQSRRDLVCRLLLEKKKRNTALRAPSRRHPAR